ncbi:DUF1109 domain-containing protein [Elioraea sp.]|uniref:DUF1109 domain-containing protein n=1 Tax=Elioraea sp. TaxID=2185103 RepID=UPI0025BCEA7E|nr:DUF1109 domain-containing protein [Elioraea sp.]
MKTDDLVSAMAREMGPVKRLRPPMVRAALWLGFSVAVIAAIVAVSGPRDDLAQRLAQPWEAAQMAMAAITAVLAAISAFHLTLPDRSDRWALLPLPSLVLWVGTLGWGCVVDFVRLGPDGIALGTSFGCLGFILGLSLPMGGALLVALRHAGPIRPGPTMAIGVLSIAMLASVGLSIVHYLDAAVMVLIWHVGAVAIATAIGGVVGGRTLARQSALVQAEA